MTSSPRSLGQPSSKIHHRFVTTLSLPFHGDNIPSSLAPHPEACTPGALIGLSEDPNRTYTAPSLSWVRRKERSLVPKDGLNAFLHWPFSTLTHAQCTHTLTHAHTHARTCMTNRTPQCHILLIALPLLVIIKVLVSGHGKPTA